METWKAGRSGREFAEFAEGFADIGVVLVVFEMVDEAVGAGTMIARLSLRGGFKRQDACLDRSPHRRHRMPGVHRRGR